MTTPFLDITAFRAEYPGTLTAGESATASRMLEVASDRVRDLAPAARVSAAAQVVFEIVRDAVMYGHLGPLSTFSNITSRRQEAGTLDAATKTVDDLLTQRHRVMLGIGAGPTPGLAVGDGHTLDYIDDGRPACGYGYGYDALGRRFF